MNFIMEVISYTIYAVKDFNITILQCKCAIHNSWNGKMISCVNNS